MNYRKSSYTIAVCVDEKDKKYMLIHGYTGAIDLVSEQLFATLNSFSGENEFEPDVFHTLLKRGYITEKTEDEERDYLKRMAMALFKRDTFFSKGFTLLVTYNCNFCCPYCFEKEVPHEKIVFTEEMVDKAYRAIMKIAPEEKLRSNHLTLYGGEPLLQSNKQIISYIIKRGKELGFTFSAITNGYDLECYEDLLSPDTIRFLQITVDGIKERHNLRRIHRQGYPTFDKILRNIGLALDKGVQVSIRINTDRNNVNDLEELQELFTQMNYMDNKLFSINTALLKNYSEDMVDTYQYFSEKDFIEWNKEHSLKVSCQDYGTYMRIYSAIKNKKPLSFRAAFCGAQTTGFVLDPLGDIYTCWEVVSQKKHCIGNYALSDEISWNAEVLNAWRKVYIIDNPICAACKYALLCGGGCPSQNLNTHHCTQMEDIVQYAATKAFQSTN